VTDQATTLRVLRGGKDKRTGEQLSPGRRALAVTGGKGGVGKSTIAANLAIAYAQAGTRTLLVDTDLGMADINLLLGIAPERSLLDALGGSSVDDVLVEAHGIHVLPALNGSYVLSTIGASSQSQTLALVDSLASKFDTLVFDIAAGIGQSQTCFAGATTDVVVVVNPEPLSMADAYACLKVLSVERGVDHAFLVPNRVSSRAQADELVLRLRALVDRFLELDLTALPYIPADPTVAAAAQIGVPLLVHAPDAPAARAIRQLTRALATLVPAAPPDASWWRSTRGATR
jgi:flagellar biosynthesis protein FlhG